MSTKVMDLVWDSSIPGTSKRSALLALANQASDQGEITAYGVENLCNKTGISRSTMFRLLRDLEDEALIQRVGRTNGDGGRINSRFWLNIPLLRSLRRPDAGAEAHDSPGADGAA